jgi:hypothetical protein
MKDILRARIQADYHYVRDHLKADKFEIIRYRAKELSLAIIDVLPMGRELDNALTKVEEACMHASAGIARMPKGNDPC